jgi:hypothetical protein
MVSVGGGSQNDSPNIIEGQLKQRINTITTIWSLLLGLHRPFQKIIISPLRNIKVKAKAGISLRKSEIC